jgi:predicted ArsR family transcriptional regulator
MQSTRQRILNAIAEAPGASAQELAGQLGLSVMSVRHHLGMLARDGLITASVQAQPGTVGRPQWRYSLTAAGSEVFPSNVTYLTSLLLQEAQERLPAAEYEALLAGVAERLAASCPPIAMPISANRLDQIVAFLNNMGYQAGWNQNVGEAGDYLVWIGRCPYRWLSQHHPELCRVDQALLARLSGASVEHLPAEAGSGSRRCVYRLRWSR